MTIRLKLTWNSIFIVTMVLGLTFLGTYLLFEQYLRESFYKVLEDQALTAAVFHLEKDELTEEKYNLIEKKYQETQGGSIRFFNEQNKMVFEKDSLAYTIPLALLAEIRKDKSRHFQLEGRQFAGIYYTDNEGNFVVLSSAVNQEGRHQLSRLRLYLFSSLFAGILVSFLLTQWLAKQTFKPFARLIENVNTISASTLHERLPVTQNQRDELSELTRAFNLFLERLENGVKSQQHFLKHASHELKTPLAAIIGTLEVTLAKDRTPEEYRDNMLSVHADALHIKAILEGLLVLSGLEGSQRPIAMHTLRLDELLWDVLEKVTPKYPDIDIQVQLEAVQDKPHVLEITANRDLLFMAIGNLLDNALKFSNKLPVTIRMGLEQEHLQLFIQDQGVGIAQEEQEAVFTLFYRGSNSQDIAGHGIGLHLSKLIFDLHQIHLNLVSSMGKGTIVQLIFPKS